MYHGVMSQNLFNMQMQKNYKRQIGLNVETPEWNFFQLSGVYFLLDPGNNKDPV